MARAPMLALLATLIGHVSSAAMAQERIPLRVGDHAIYGRMVFDWPSPPAFTSGQESDRLVLRFPPGSPLDLAGARRLPRNMAALSREGDAVVVTLRPGARTRVFRIGNRVVVDAFDPPPQAAVSPAPADPPAAAPPVEMPPAAAPEPEALPSRIGAARRPPVAEAPPLAAAPASETPLAALAQPAAALPPEPPPSPLPANALAVRLLGQPGQDRAILLPYPATTGATLLRRGTGLLAAFDNPAPLNLAALRNDPVFAGLQAEAVPGGMLLRLPLAAPTVVRARREPNGWVLEASRAAAPRDPGNADRAMMLETEGNPPSRLAIHATQPAAVMAVADPDSGMPLLLGLVAAPGQAMPVARRLPELDLPATLLGVAVLARADRVTLRASTNRFVLAAAGARLSLDGTAAQPAAAPAMTRIFDFPAMPPTQLLERVRALQGGLAATPPLTRAQQRRAVAEALLALGLPQEAQAMIGLGMAESPAAAADPALRALSGIAALLAGRLAEAAPLREATLPESDELAFWRAALAAALGDPVAAAPGLAATLPLLLDYPAGLRNRLLPGVALALAEAGSGPALQQLLAAAPPELDLGLARGILAEGQGRVQEALEAFDRVAAGRDRQARARALRRAIELRLATGRIEPPAAARAMEATLLAWRGDAEEVATRLRVAGLRRLAGDPRGAMALLRESEPLFPDQAASIRAGIADAFVAALESEAPLPAVALFDAYPELLPAGERGEQVVLLLAERLAALELTDRATALLRQAADRASGVQRGSLGLRLAALRLAEADAAGALDALAATEVPGLPAALALGRVTVAARAEARRGRLAEARAMLEPLGTEGQATLAELLVEAQDWAAAGAALGAHLRAMPAALNETQQRAVLRQAAILALAGDEPALAALRNDFAPRLAGSRFAASFAALTADPMRGLADLPRLQQELQLFRSVPNRLEALRAGAPATR